MYDHEYTEKLKKYHLCIRCRKQDAYTLGGRSLCFDCSEYYHQRRKTYYKTNREKVLQQNREKRYECIKNNICSKCLRRKTDGIHKICVTCRTTQNAKRRSKSTYIPGINCYHCKKPLDGQLKDDGNPSSLCSSCYARTVELATKNAQRKTNDKKMYCMQTEI